MARGHSSGDWLAILGVTAALGIGPAARPAAEAAVTTPYPILFVTQVPIPADFTTVNSMFGNHRAGMSEAGRGGDLWIRYPDGTLKNLTQAAGFGSAGFQGAAAIAVRDPDVHWDAQKAVFSMAVGWVDRQYEIGDYLWQLYEVTGLGPTDTPVITRLANQPADANNVMPVYGSDDRIIFISDRARNGAAHLRPQLDEYELAPSNSGVWSLDPETGDLALLDHSPSGDFYPLVDSFGRVVFTRWDHMQRDQEADADSAPGLCGGGPYGTFNYADESENSPWDENDRTEVFPEPRACRTDLLAGTPFVGHTFNQFFPWTVAQDGTGLETLNHVGRHELNDYFSLDRNDDPNVVYFNGPGPRANRNRLNNLQALCESPTAPGTYFGIDAPEFGTHAAGQVVNITGSPEVYADQMVVSYVTHRDTASFTDTPGPDHSGLYRDPLVLADGTIVAAHTYDTRQDQNVGSGSSPQSRYSFRLETLAPAGNGYLAASQMLTPGIQKDLSWWSPDVMTTYNGLLWELNPVEVRARPRPPIVPAAIPAPETQMFVQAGVDPAAFRGYLKDNGLALVVSRDVTTRDQADRQQPFNLRVPGGVQTVASAGTVYDVADLQFFQADQIRGWKGCCNPDPNPGRRVLARPLHDPAALACDPTPAGRPEGSRVLAADGSMAAIVPARRALTWQLTSPAGEGVVRERYWVSFQPGEVRVCASCHGLNSKDQIGRSVPQNPPQALKDLLMRWADCALGSPKLLRNTDLTSANPLSTPLSSLFPLNESRDFLQALAAPGDLDVDDTIVGDRIRPLAFYGVTTPVTVRLVKSAGRLAVYY